MANAQEVLSQLTNTWSSMLDKFYDSVADEYLLWMSKEYKIDLKTLKEKAAPLKTKLLSKATESVSSVKTTKKPVAKTKVLDTSKYGNMSRKELIEHCKNRSLPVKRKNQDMIDLLKTYDDEHKETEMSEESETHGKMSEKEALEEDSEDEASNSDTEPEIVEKPKKKPVTKAVKTIKPTKPMKNELIEETMSDEEDED
jgi:hypothetical protein